MAIHLPRWLRRAAIGCGSALALATGLIGFAHTRAGRPLLGLIGLSCPVLSVKPAEAEAMRQGALRSLRGDVRALKRPALGFELDVTTLAQARTWAARAGVSCKVEHRGYDFLTCARVPSRAIALDGVAVIDSLSLAFGPRGTLIGVETYCSHRSSEEALRLYASDRQRLVGLLGVPTAERGEATPRYLASGYLYLASVHYAFSDYLARVTVANLGPSGIVVREQYQSANRAM